MGTGCKHCQRGDHHGHGEQSSFDGHQECRPAECKSQHRFACRGEPVCVVPVPPGQTTPAHREQALADDQQPCGKDIGDVTTQELAANDQASAHTPPTQPTSNRTSVEA